ncbi:MAG: YHYH domain-containing protein [Pseudomonadota bacterium]
MHLIVTSLLTGLAPLPVATHSLPQPPVAAIEIAHGGGLDSAGCHNDRKRGTYHCHRS